MEGNLGACRSSPRGYRKDAWTAWARGTGLTTTVLLLILLCFYCSGIHHLCLYQSLLCYCTVAMNVHLDNICHLAICFLYALCSSVPLPSITAFFYVKYICVLVYHFNSHFICVFCVFYLLSSWYLSDVSSILFCNNLVLIIPTEFQYQLNFNSVKHFDLV